PGGSEPRPRARHDVLDREPRHLRQGQHRARRPVRDGDREAPQLPQGIAQVAHLWRRPSRHRDDHGQPRDREESGAPLRRGVGAHQAAPDARSADPRGNEPPQGGRRGRPESSRAMGRRGIPAGDQRVPDPAGRPRRLARRRLRGDDGRASVSPGSAREEGAQGHRRELGHSLRSDDRGRLPPGTRQARKPVAAASGWPGALRSRASKRPGGARPAELGRHHPHGGPHVSIESVGPAVETGAAKAKRSILVIDDDRRVLELLQISLTQNGFRVAIASSGEEGLEVVRKDTPDLVILDLRLPRKTGFEVCAALKSSKDTAHIPIIMVSASAEVDSRLQGLMHGADDYMTKPFSPKELLIKVRRIFERLDRAEHLTSKNKELESEVARNKEDLVIRNKELRFQVYSLETLMGLTHQLNASLEMDDLLNTLILSVVGQLRVNSACLFLTDQREHPTRLEASTFKGIKEEQARSIAFAYGGDFVGALLPTSGDEGRPVRLAELEDDPALEAEVGSLFAAGFTVVSPVLMKRRLTAILA